MTPEEYAEQDATGLAQLIKERAVSQKDVVQATISAIESLNPKLNAVIEYFQDRVETLEDWPEEADRPFAGVPWLLKDIGAGEPGRKQEQGSRLMVGSVVQEETHLFSKMRAAGLIPLGRTTVPEFAYDCNTETLLQGSTHNPWDLARSAGGSSGGAAACVASGIVPAAHASDGGGSIRIPASLNGLVGLKPTRGRVSTWPIFIADRPLGHATEFVVSRTVRDQARFLDAFHGPAPSEPQTLAAPTTSYSGIVEMPLRNLKVAVNWNNGGPCLTDASCIEAIKRIGTLLSDAGHIVEEGYPDVEFQTFASAMSDLWSVEITTMLDHLSAEMDRPLDETTLEPNALKMISRSQALSAQNLMDALLTQDLCSKHFHDFLTDYDVLITPATCTPAPLLGQTGPYTEKPWMLDFGDPASAALCQYTFQANATGQPAISLPLGWTNEGLPIGVQIQARYGDEVTLLQLARFFERTMPWMDRYPPLYITTQAGAEHD
ncbi:MAG: amidase [Hyphomonas sp.]|nr:amidase [Hyphomonas sp.]